MTDQLLELQPALVLKFIKKVLRDEQFIISSNLKTKFSHTLTIFLHYIMTIASQISKEKHRSTVTVEDLKKALEETGWDDDFLSNLDSKVLELGAKSTKSNRQQQKENIENLEENNFNNNNESPEKNGGMNNDEEVIAVEEEIKSDNEANGNEIIEVQEEESID